MAETIHEAIYTKLVGDATAEGYFGSLWIQQAPDNTDAPYTVMNLVGDPNANLELCYTDQGQAVFQFDLVVAGQDKSDTAKIDGINRRNNLRKWVVANFQGLTDGNINIANCVVNDIPDRADSENDLFAYGFEATFIWRYLA